MPSGRTMAGAAGARLEKFNAALDKENFGRLGLLNCLGLLPLVGGLVVGPDMPKVVFLQNARLSHREFSSQTAGW